jgi:cysteine desulfurase
MSQFQSPNVEKRLVYVDHAAATPMDSRVLEAMLPYFTIEFGNPGGLYDAGREALYAVTRARTIIANIFGCNPGNILFTGSGTESDNMAIFGIARQYASKGKHLVSNPIEHHAVLHPLESLTKEGFETTSVAVDETGRVHTASVIAALREDTTLVSIMYANNEIGTVNPIAEIGNAIQKWKKEHGRGPTEPPFFHTDACQAAGALELNVEKLHVDLMTINGSKIYGPKGVGALFVRKGISLKPIIVGGGQEFRKRAGTENVAYIVGLATALANMQAEKETENARLIALRDWFISELQTRMSKIVLNGHPTERLPNNVNVSILDIEGEALILYLDEYGISMSTGSACTSESLDPSHVITGIGRPYEYAHSSMRFTFGKATTREDLEYVLAVLVPTVAFLRQVSPVRVAMDNAKDVSMASAFVTDGLPHFVTKK